MLVPLRALLGSRVCPAAAAVGLRATDHRVPVPVRVSPEVKPVGGSLCLRGSLCGYWPTLQSHWLVSFFMKNVTQEVLHLSPNKSWRRMLVSPGICVATCNTSHPEEARGAWQHIESL
jgi:hypothetical protein